MWVIVFAAMGSVAALAIVALSVPVDATVHLSVPEKPRFQLKIRWLFGLVEKEIRKGPARKKTPEKAEAVKKGKPAEKATFFVRILRTRGFVRQVVTLVKDIFRCFNFINVAVNLRIGLDNPADTGMLFGIIAPATVFIPSSARRDINIQPDFQNGTLEGYVDGTVRLHPIELLPPVLRFIFSPPAIRVAKQMVTANVQKRRKG